MGVGEQTWASGSAGYAGNPFPALQDFLRLSRLPFLLMPLPLRRWDVPSFLPNLNEALDGIDSEAPPEKQLPDVTRATTLPRND
jgi:hypothetical protein